MKKSEIEYYYIITVQHQDSSGTTHMLTRWGVGTDSTRSCAFNYLYQETLEMAGLDRANVVFFSLEPNVL